MSNLSFNKNCFVKSNPATLSKPIINNPNKLGRRTVEEIKEDMHLLNKPKVKYSRPKVDNSQINKSNNLNSLRSFKEWNKK